LSQDSSSGGIDCLIVEKKSFDSESDASDSDLMKVKFPKPLTSPSAEVTATGLIAAAHVYLRIRVRGR
jgi:hypothetical protein